MSKLVAIIRNNSDTFYNFDTSEKIPIRRRLAATLLVALATTAIFKSQTDEFVTAVVAAQAILVGFTFSVMFYILNGPQLDKSNESLEAELRSERIAQLGRELFYNVSYFNLVAIGCVVAALLLLAGMDYDGPPRAVAQILEYAPALRLRIEQLNEVARLVLYVMFYSLLIESMYTFIRTTGRVTYYFERRLEG